MSDAPAMKPVPWTLEKRCRVSEKIISEARRTARRLGAQHCVVIAFFPEGGDHFHMQDAGEAPMPLIDLYKKLVTFHEMLKASGGEDVTVQ